MCCLEGYYKRGVEVRFLAEVLHIVHISVEDPDA